MPIPLPGWKLRTIARARTWPLGKSKIKSMLEPAEAGVAVCRKRPPRPITSARDVQVCLADFQPTHMPLGARTRGYFLGILGSGDMGQGLLTAIRKSYSVRGVEPLIFSVGTLQLVN